jgi:hypothetical protein
MRGVCPDGLPTLTSLAITAVCAASRSTPTTIAATAKTPITAAERLN